MSPTKNSETPSTHQKALEINLDAGKYGAIAEIGAGQEVARWFFRVGAAAGTVAKTMSAYDMKVSDAIYGKSSRYVSRDRVVSMLDHEWALLLERLDKERGKDTSFFVFADTISARNYHGTNICHGWLGVRYQLTPRSEPITVCLHVNMRDDSNILQQQAVGVLGINLIYGVYEYQASLDTFVRSLLDNLTLDQIDIDFLSVSGPAFNGACERNLLVALLKNEVTPAIGFSASGKPSVPMDFLYKSPVILERGNFRKVGKIHEDLLIKARAHYEKECVECKRDAVEVLEITTNDANPENSTDFDEITERLDKLHSIARPVLVTSYAEGYHLTRFLRRYTPEPIRFSMGIAHLTQVLDERHYEHLAGGLVEGVARLIGAGVKIYVYPMDSADLAQSLKDSSDEVWVFPQEGPATLANVHPVNATRHLYSYLFETGALLPISLGSAGG